MEKKQRKTPKLGISRYRLVKMPKDENTIPDLSAYISDNSDFHTKERASQLQEYLRNIWMKQLRADDDGIALIRANEEEDFATTGSSLGDLFRFVVEENVGRPLGIAGFFSLLSDIPDSVVTNNAKKLRQMLK